MKSDGKRMINSHGSGAVQVGPEGMRTAPGKAEVGVKWGRKRVSAGKGENESGIRNAVCWRERGRGSEGG